MAALTSHLICLCVFTVVTAGLSMWQCRQVGRHGCKFIERSKGLSSHEAIAAAGNLKLGNQRREDEETTDSRRQ